MRTDPSPVGADPMTTDANPDADAARTAPPRRRARWRRTLSVRGLMLLVLVAALAAGWYARGLAARREAVATIRAAGGKIQYRDQFKNGSGFYLALYRRTGWEFTREISRVDLNKPSAQTRSAGEPLLPDPADPPPRDEVFAALGRLGHVETVMIEAGPIPPAHREALAAVGVVRLYVQTYKAPPIDDSLADLSQVRSLRVLAIDANGGTILPPSILRWVGRMTQLQGFAINGGNETVPASFEADATTLARLNDLETLYLARAPVDGAYLDDLAGAHRLRRLDAAATRITDAQLRRLAGREPDLEVLILDGSLLSDAGAEALERLPRLQRLFLYGRPGTGPGITDATLGTVARLGALRFLHLTCGRFTDRELEALRASPVEVLELGWFDSASPEALTRLLAGRAWKVLGFRGPGIDDATLPAILAGLGGSTVLSLADSGVTDAGMVSLGAAPLRVIDLSGAPITDAGMAALARTPAARRILNRTALTDAGLMALGRGASPGQWDLRGTPITPAGLAAFRRVYGTRFNISIGPLRPGDER